MLTAHLHCHNDQLMMPIPGGFLHSSVCWTCRSPSWLTSGWPRGCHALLAPQQLPWVSPGQQLQQLFGRVYLTACAAPHLHFRTARQTMRWYLEIVLSQVNWRQKVYCTVMYYLKNATRLSRSLLGKLFFSILYNKIKRQTLKRRN